ncbi:MAG: allantoinase AllB [Solirubrobacteraceae bacterium]|nr:allantoinase AllB [Patulibacter sp.]
MTTPPDPDPTTPADLVVVAARAILPGGEQPAAIEVRDGHIAAIHAADGPVPAARETVHLDPSEVLIPALVDSHVHANEPGRTHWEGLRTLTAAAAAGGIGTVVDMPLNCIPSTTNPPAVEAKRASCPDPSIDVAMWGGAVADELGLLPELFDAGVFGLKAFMVNSGVDEFAALTTDAGLRHAMQACAAAGRPLLVHAEDATEVERAPSPDATTYAGLLASRPIACETRAIERLAALAQETGAHVHVVHVTSEEGVAVIAAARAAGIHLTGETCPHYLFLAAEELPDRDPRVKCFPPIRERRHRDALWAGLQTGTLSLVASDHSPSPWDLKDTGDLSTAWGGIASIQVAFPVVWTAARERGIPLTDVVRWMAAAPADLAGLPQKGRIEVGADADLAILDPDATFTVIGTELLHRHPQNPYEGRELHGVVKQTWVRGRLVGSSAPHGRWLAQTATGPVPMQPRDDVATTAPSTAATAAPSTTPSASTVPATAPSTPLPTEAAPTS